MDSPSGSARLVSVVLPVLHGAPRPRRCAADQAMARDRASRGGDSEALRAWRSRVPPAPTAGRAPLGLRQQKDLTSPIRIGISSCLLGNGVRFDGGHKKDSFLTGTFGRF